MSCNSRARFFCVTTPTKSFTPCPSTTFKIQNISNYIRYISGGPRVVAYLGQNTVVVVAEEARTEFNPDMTDPVSNAAMSLIVRNLDNMLPVYQEMVGMTNQLTYTSAMFFEGRTTYEINFLPGAAGLAGSPIRGAAIGPGFINNMYKQALKNVSLVEHVFFYETMRNWIFPAIFTKLFDYSTADGPLSTGWINQGFINVVGCCFSEVIKPAVEFYYYGLNRNQFMDQMEGHLFKYVGNSSYTWQNTWMQARLPWLQSASVDNLVSGLVVNLYKQFGGFAFLKSFFRSLPELLPRAPTSTLDNAAVRDNIYLAASIGAGGDLRSYFTKSLRWNISQAALQYLKSTRPNIPLLETTITVPKTTTLSTSTSTRATTKAPTVSTAAPSMSSSRIFLTKQSYSMNLGGIAGADKICTSEAGIPSKALLVDETGCSGKPCRKASSPQIDWPLKPSKAYYNLDGSAVIATTSADGLLPANLASPVSFTGGCLNEITGMAKDWSTRSGFTCQSWTTSTGQGAVGWLCPTGTSTSDLLQGGTVNCDRQMRFLCVT